MLAFGYLSLKAAIFLQVGVLALLKGLKHRHDEGKRVTDLTKPSRLAGVESYKYLFMVQVKIGIRKTCSNVTTHGQYSLCLDRFAPECGETHLCR